VRIASLIRAQAAAAAQEVWARTLRTGAGDNSSSRSSGWRRMGGNSLSSSDRLLRSSEAGWHEPSGVFVLAIASPCILSHNAISTCACLAVASVRHGACILRSHRVCTGYCCGSSHCRSPAASSYVVCSYLTIVMTMMMIMQRIKLTSHGGKGLSVRSPEQHVVGLLLAARGPPLS
jgi:hypothetical protein